MGLLEEKLRVCCTAPSYNLVEQRWFAIKERINTSRYRDRLDKIRDNYFLRLIDDIIFNYQNDEYGSAIYEAESREIGNRIIRKKGYYRVKRISSYNRSIYNQPNIIIQFCIEGNKIDFLDVIIEFPEDRT